MLIFGKNLAKESIYSSSVEEIIIEKLGIDSSQNLSCEVDFQTFKDFFCDKLGKDDSKIVFGVLIKDEFFMKYFGPLVTVDPDTQKQVIKVIGMRILFRDRYDIKISVRKYLELGVKMSIRFLEEAKEYYGKIIKIFDADGDGFISFREFRKIIKKVDSQRADWKIHAIYQRATGVEDSEKG